MDGFSITEEIHRGKSVVYRGTRLEDSLSVIIKTLGDMYPLKDSFYNFELEYNILSKLDHPGIIKVYSKKKFRKSSAIIMEDFKGISLKEKIKSEKLRVKKFLKLALQIVDAVGYIHKNKIVHKDLNPSNILVNSDTHKVKLIDFASSSLVSQERFTHKSFNELGKSISYISPEQTGRVRSHVDYRSDFYSLGITFYEMLTGELPFLTSDTIEVIHSHIAKDIDIPIHRFPEVPNVFWSIIRKMTSKDKRDRYQSVVGLRKDLEQCQKYLDNTGSVKNFNIGEYDLLDRLEIPQKLYGRENEIKVLLDGFYNSTDGNEQVCLIAGGSGTGKTTLVNEIQESIVEEKAYFVSGKFEQFQQDLLYSAIIKALKNLVKQLLCESKERLDLWKVLILDAVEANGQLIVDVIPELEKIIGNQPEVQRLNTKESKSRFVFTLQCFIRVFAKKEHPLVIFLDDLQWADIDTLILIETFISYNSIEYFYFIGAYRDDEVKPGHPFLSTIEELKKKRTVNHIELQPLSKRYIKQIVTDTLSLEKSKVAAITSVLLKKTDGNPYYLKELFKSFHKNGLIWYDTSKMVWDLNQETIEKFEISENVIEYTIKKLNKLPSDCIEALKTASCIGIQFDLNSVAKIMNTSNSKVISLFRDAIEEEIIQPIDNKYRIAFIENSDLKFEYTAKFSFIHDKVQQAAYNLIDNNTRKKIHFAYGKILLTNLDQGVEGIRLIDTVYHLNKGRLEINNIQEKNKLCQLNLDAGINSRKSTAFNEAYFYLKTAIELLPGNSWEKSYEQSFSIFKEFSECAYLIGKNEIAEKHLYVLLDKAKTKLEKTKIFNILTHQYSTSGKMKNSIDIGLEGLKLAGLNISENPNFLAISREYLIIKWNQGNKKIHDLIDSPKMTDENIIEVFKLIIEILPSAYLTGNKNLFVLLILKMVNFSLKYGNCAASAYAFSCYGVLLGSVFKNQKDGYEFGKLGMSINQYHHDPKIECKIYHVYTDFIFHWGNHWSEMEKLQKKGIKIGYQAGDLLNISYIAHHSHTWNPQFNLKEIIDKKIHDRDIIKETGYLDALNETDLFINTCRNYTNLTKNKYSLDYEEFNEIDCINEMKNNNFITGITVYHLWKSEIYTFYEVYDKAIEHIKKANLTKESIMALPYIPRLSLVTFLAYSGQHNQMNNRDKKLAKKNMKKEYKQMKKYAEFCPDNFKHLQLIMKAELERVSGNFVKALKMYNESIITAHKNKWLRDEAMANELAAKFLLEMGQEKTGMVYLYDSYYLYNRWGATRKVKDMKEKYHNLLLDTPILNKDTDDSKTINILPNYLTQSGFTDNGPDNLSSLDLLTIVKSSQAISEEIVLENFLKKMMKIVVENAGAQRGYFITEVNNDLVIQAKACLRKNNIDVKLDISAEDFDKLPKKIINYVARNREKIVIYDACQDEIYQNDHYIKTSKIKSILCIPLLRHNKLGGVLYLENNLATGAFTEERIKILEILTSEILISLENAKLYKSLEEHKNKLEQEVFDRTRELSETNSLLKDKNQKLEETQKELESMAMTDPLTKLFNRRSMMEKLLREELQYKRTKRNFTIILTDIDNFKFFNDKYGHDCGDFILQSLSKEMKSSLRAQDIVSRWGGEEFLILLPETDAEGAKHIGEKLRKNISEQLFTYQNINLSVTLTLGVTTYDVLENIEECIKLADKGLYEGKKKGKNCVVFMDNKN